MPDGAEIFTFDDMVATSTGTRVNTVGPVFDLDKLGWLNGHYIRELSVEDLAGRIVDHLVRRGVLPAEPTAEQRALVLRGHAAGQERMQLLSEAEGMLGFLLVDEDDFAVDPDDAAEVPDRRRGGGARRRPCTALAGARRPGRPPTIEAALRAALVDGLGLKPKVAFGAGAGRGHRSAGLAAAVRVARAARPGPIAGAAAGRRGDGRGLAARGRLP